MTEPSCLMKSYAPIITVIIFVVLAVSLGFGAAIYAGLALIGLTGLAVLSAFVWMHFDKQHLEADQQHQTASEKKAAASPQPRV